ALALKTQDMRLDVRDLLLRKAGASAPLLRLPSLSVEGGSFDIAGNRLVLARVAMSGGAFSAGLDPAGTLDWETLVPASPAPVASVPAMAEPATPWSVEVASMSIDDTGFDVLDQTRNAPLGLALRLTHAGFALRAASDGNAPAVALTGVALEAGDIVLSTGMERSALGSITRLALSGAEADVAAERLAATRLVIEGLQTTLHRERDGELREVRLASVPDPVTPLPVSHAAAEWKVRLGEFRVDGIDVALEDRMTTPAIAFAVKGGSIGVKDIDTAADAPLQLSAKLPVAEGGELLLSGSAKPDGAEADITLDIRSLALTPLAPLVAQDTILLLDAGTLSTSLAIGYRAPADSPLALKVSGSASLDDLRLREAEGGAHFLGWRSLAAAGIEFSLGPDRLGITEVRLAGADAKVVVQKDRGVNLA
ncbi:MAG: DUF748 domain-containing protein, partial [Gammaproteobacteria bacterium]